MALLNGFMPGETAGMPTGYTPDYGQGNYGGLLSGDNPLLNVGLGILANNNGNYGSFGAAIGKGGLQGIQQTQQARQLAQQKQLRDLQMQQEQQNMDEYTRKRSAVDAFKAKFPDYAQAVDLDPSLAIKAAYPNISAHSADPYYQFLPTAGGYASGNARTGQVQMVLDPQGRPIVKASDSPELQGRIAGAKEAAQADYKVNTDIPGQIMTERQVAEQANPLLRQSPMGLPPQPQSLPQLPQANVQGNFNGNPQAILSQINRITDPQERANAMQAFQQQYGQMPQQAPQQQLPAPVSNSLVGGGIRVPTPAELAATKKAAEMKAENTAQAQMDLPKIRSQAQTQLNQIDQLIGSEDGKIKPHPGFEPAVGLSSYNPLNKLAGSSAVDFNNRLDQLKGGAFLQAFNDLKGGGQITEVEGKKATDAIARMNTSTSEEEFKNAARDYQSVIRNALNRTSQKAGVSGSQENPQAASAIPLPAKPSALTLKKGTVYATPKGNLTWNGKAFED